MNLCLFDELNRTTAAYCKALGLDATPYETPLSPDEVLIANERRWLVDRGMAPEKADKWAPINVLQGVSNEPHAVIEYARPPEKVAEANRLAGESMDRFFDECRRRTIAPIFTGD
jgi:hypothetical protein